MATEITLSQLLELVAADDREALFEAYTTAGYHYLGIYGDASGTWQAFGIGPREDVRTLMDMDRLAPKSTIVAFYVPCPGCPHPGKLASYDVFSYFHRWAKELSEKEAQLQTPAGRIQAAASGAPITPAGTTAGFDLALVQERAEVEVKAKMVKEKEAEIAEREKDLRVARSEVEAKIAAFSQKESLLVQREAFIINKEKEVERLEARIKELKDDEKNLDAKLTKLRSLEKELEERKKGLDERENYVMESEQRVMELTMEQQEREAKLEQMLDDIQKMQERAKAG